MDLSMLIKEMKYRTRDWREESDFLKTPDDEDQLGEHFIHKLCRMHRPLTDEEYEIAGRFLQTSFNRAATRATNYLLQASLMNADDMLRADYIHLAKNGLKRAMWDLARAMIALPGFNFSPSRDNLALIDEIFRMRDQWAAEAEFPGRGALMGPLEAERRTALAHEDYRKAAEVQRQMDSYAFENLFQN